MAEIRTRLALLDFPSERKVVEMWMVTSLANLEVFFEIICTQDYVKTSTDSFNKFQSAMNFFVSQIELVFVESI